ncbi:MAG: hypothetical protein M3O91_02410 [Chloroflexota bacterium]|nr:hypothetical protein [Chloroflexota bacterium]
MAVTTGVAVAAVASTSLSSRPSAASPGAPSDAVSTPRATPTSGTPSPTADPLAITAAAYGSLSLNAPAGASCSIAVRVVPGTRGERPPTTITATPGASGQLDLHYSAPRVPAGQARYDVSCDTPSGSLRASASFTVPSRSISASGFTVHLVADRALVDGIVDDPRLVPLRDGIVARIQRDLVAEWSAATRGLGAVVLVGESADIRIIVAAQRGTSVNRTDADSSEDVIVYAEDDSGALTPENSVAVALHELGHIWCCRGPGTTAGHWTTKEESPGLYGVDKYGLMNHPVECLTLPSGIETCPNRFSDRELRSMGFTEIPAPVPDLCIARSLELKALLADVEARLDALGPGIEAAHRSIDDLAAEITAIETQYPTGIPASVYPHYSDLVARNNSLVSSNRPRIDSYNSLVRDQRATVDQLQALPCSA